MDKEELKKRTKKFALDVFQLVERFPRTKSANVIEYQLIKSSSSVGANYRSACRARSRSDFIAKIGIVEEEADELVSIFTASRKTAKSKI